MEAWSLSWSWIWIQPKHHAATSRPSYTCCFLILREILYLRIYPTWNWLIFCQPIKSLHMSRSMIVMILTFFLMIVLLKTCRLEITMFDWISIENLPCNIMGCRNQWLFPLPPSLATSCWNRKQKTSMLCRKHILKFTHWEWYNLFIKYFCLHRWLSYTNSKASNMSYIN